MPVVHKLEKGPMPTRTMCGLVPWYMHPTWDWPKDNRFARTVHQSWRGVTCKRCLRTKPR